MADESRIAQLIYSKLRGEILYHEQEELEQWLKEDPANQAFLDEYLQEDGLLAELSKVTQMNEAMAWKQFEQLKDAQEETEQGAAGAFAATGEADGLPREIEEETENAAEEEEVELGGMRAAQEGMEVEMFAPRNSGKSGSRRTWIYAAAIIAGSVVVGGWLYFERTSGFKDLDSDQHKVIAQTPTTQIDPNITPSENRAFLTLADQTLIQLDTVKNGDHLANNPAVWKKDSNTIVLGNASGAMVSVPSRAMYHVQLPDGTKAILNAGSTLRWAAAYSEGQRTVELEGEGYFEVAKDELHPFHVRTKRWAVQALGTAFDLRDYKNEPRLQAVLQSGKLIVQDQRSNKMETVTLQPHQSAESNIDKPGIRVEDKVDLESVLAWKRGYFNFDKLNVRDAVRCIAEWYGMQVAFEGGSQDGTLGVGDIQRDLPIQILLRDLEMPNLHFVVMNDTIVVKRTQ